MVDPTPSPSPTPTTAPGTVQPWTPPGTPVTKPPTNGSSGASSGGLTNAQKAVWFMRPQPLFTNTQNLAGIAMASDPSNPNMNAWYDKADVEGQYTSLSYTDQLLFEAVAASMGNRKTGSGLFGDMVAKSAYESTAGRKVTPQQLMYELAYQRGVLKPDGTFDIAAAKRAAAGGGGGGGAKYGTTTDTARTVNETDPDTAKSLVSSALKSYLGHDVSPEDLGQFIANLHAHEQANATTTSRTTTTSPGGSVSSTQQTGGVNAQQFAEDWARAQEGSAEFQAASGYFDEFVKAIQNPMDVVK